MSIGSPKLARRDAAIEATRRRLRRLEIETHRIKAELARLEAEYEDDVADWLTRKLRRREPIVSEHSGESHTASIDLAPNSAAGATVWRFDGSPVTGVSERGSRSKSASTRKSHPGISPPPIIAGLPAGATSRDGGRERTAKTYRKAASPILFSVVVHLIILSFCLSVTIATIAQQEVELIASPTDLNEDASEISEVEIKASDKFEDSELQNKLVESPDFNIADSLARELEPVELGAGAQNRGDIGQLDALPGDVGALMAGAGDPGAGKPGGPLGEAVFFGARSKGDRFVFVVDNSSSMKGGRLEAANAELLQAVHALSPRQSFYVIFVSDQTYPMFFPRQSPDMVPATPENKRRLAEWVPNAILASGNNRKLIEAMDMAATLRPQAVFLLWDGDMKYSDKVRIEVMTHLTRPNQWDFVIHTLGMGTLSLDSQQNLAAIAAAHGGVFQRVDVPPARAR
jgi:hypothetical protein